MTDAATLLSEARHAMGVLWSEIETVRQHAVSLPDDFSKLRDFLRDHIQKLEHIMSIHDDVAALFDDCDALVDKLIAKKGDSDAANADLKVKGTALRDKITKALGEDALAPSSVPPNTLLGS